MWIHNRKSCTFSRRVKQKPFKYGGKMKKIFIALMMTFSTAFAFADSQVLLGFWEFGSNLSIGGKDYGHIYAGENDYTVASWKTIGFLACAREMYPDAPVYLFSNGKNEKVVTDAYICTGEINLSNCSKKQRACDGPTPVRN